MSEPNYFHDLALSKLALVFGHEKAQAMLIEIATSGGLVAIADAQDLLVFSGILKQRGGFESTVGAMLGLQAVLRGATAA